MFPKKEPENQSFKQRRRDADHAQPLRPVQPQSCRNRHWIERFQPFPLHSLDGGEPLAGDLSPLLPLRFSFHVGDCQARSIPKPEIWMLDIKGSLLEKTCMATCYKCGGYASTIGPMGHQFSVCSECKRDDRKIAAMRQAVLESTPEGRAQIEREKQKRNALLGAIVILIAICILLIFVIKYIEPILGVVATILYWAITAVVVFFCGVAVVAIVKHLKKGPSKPRNVLSAICSGFVPGLGQLIQARIGPAAFFFFTYWASILTFVKSDSLVGVFGFCGWFIVWIWSIVNAARWKPPQELN